MKWVTFLRQNDYLSLSQAAKELGVAPYLFRQIALVEKKVPVILVPWGPGEKVAVRRADVIALRDRMYGGR